MHRFFADTVINEDKIDIFGSDYYHIKNVLRISDNERIEIVSEGKLYIGLVQIHSEFIRVFDLRFIESLAESKHKIHLLQCLLKGEKMDYVIQKSVELGVHDITLIKSNRCITKYDKKKELEKIKRYQKIAYESAKQAKRLIIPEIKGVIPINGIKEYINKSYLLIAYEKDKDKSLKKVLKQIIDKVDLNDIFVLIGPEGGFEEAEISNLISDNIVTIGLGERILRADTAGIAIISMLQYEFI